MNSDASISVIIPTVGRTHFLLDAVRSVYAQTLAAAEVVLVCDGIGAEGHKAIEPVLSEYPLLRVVNLNKPSGVSAARNAGLEASSGDFVLFLDDDDILHPRMLERSLQAFAEKPQTDVVTSLYQVIFTPYALEDYPATYPFNFKMLKSHPLSGVDRSNFAPRQALKQSPTSAFLRYLIPVDSCLIKRSSIKDVQFSTDLKQGEDTFFWLQLAHRGCRFELLEETLVFIRRHGANTTRSVQDYVTEIPACYRKIQQAGLAPARSDTFLVKLKLFYFRWKVNKLSALPLLLGLLQYPILLLGETFKFFTVTLRDRKRLLKYYFSD